MHTVAHVIDANFPRTWYECVAIVQGVLSELTPGSHVPDAADLMLNADGSIGLGFASESSELPVISLARLLGALLEGADAPGGLRDLVTGNSKEPPTHTSLESFGRALAFYERPNRAAEVAGVVNRLLHGPGAAPSSVDDEFARLRERVAASGKAPQEGREPERPREPKARLSKRQLRIAGAALALVLIVLMATVRDRLTGSSSAGVVIDRIETTVAYAIAGVLNQITGSRTAAAPESEAPEPAATPTPRPARSRAPATNARAATGGTTTASGAESTARRASPRDRSERAANRPGGQSAPPLFLSAMPPLVVSSSGRPAFFETLSASASEPVAAGSRGVSPAVYSSTDSAVQPPALVRPQFPREPEPGDDTGYFDLVVDEQGNVERVKLLSPRRLFQERMLVAAAKAWKFRPAILEGQYVKYRLRVPIILTGMP